jgi:hypothetical protein
MIVGLDRGVARRGHDSLVGREQVVGVRMEIRDPADHRRARDEMVGVRQQAGHQVDVARVALDQRVMRVIVVGARDRPVLRVVVDADDVGPASQQLLHEIAADESGGTADDDRAHDGEVILGPKA